MTGWKKKESHKIESHIIIDVDTFKSVNDTYGHAMGDTILQKVATLLKRTFRSIDYVCRIGGDEFAIIMVEMTSDLKYTIEEKIETIATKIYGADKVVYTAAAARQKKRLTELGYGNLPICMAKNQYSLSDDPKKLGRPEGFDITIREIYVNAGAGFLVALTGDVMTMPGLPKKPAAEGIDVNDDGVITGLF